MMPTLRRLGGLLVIVPGLAAAQLPPIFDATPRKIGASRTLASLPKNTFLENLVVDAAGAVLVTSHEDGVVWRLAGSRLERFAQLPGKIAGIAERPGGGYVLTGADRSGRSTIFTLDAAGQPGPALLVEGGQFLNGIAALGDDRYLVADSYRGALWHVDPAAGTTRVWLEDALLARADPKGVFPAANGVQVQGRTVWVSNTARQLLLSLPVGEDGRPGPLRVVKERVNIDDFAVEADGSILGTTHVYNSLVRIRPDGSTTVVAEAAQGMTGSTSVALVRHGPDAGRAYVTTNGGMFLPPSTGVQPALLVQVEPGR